MERERTLWDARLILFFGLFLPLILIGLSGCASAPSVTVRPCGVIEDDLKTVTATSAQGQQRLDIHYERGRRAKCW